MSTYDACVHTQDGYNTNVYHLTFINYVRQFHHQNYAIIHTTAGSVTPWSIRCILMRNPGQLSSKTAKQSTGQVLLMYCKY